MYHVNLQTTSTSSEELNTWLNAYYQLANKSPEQLSERQLEIDFDGGLLNTCDKLRNFFSKTSYEILKEEDRFVFIEFALTMFTGKIVNVFTDFKSLNYQMKSKEEALNFFLFHLIILAAEKQGVTPLEYIDYIHQLLLAKNKKYGNAALSPLRIFSNQSSVEQIYVRIDDKLNRLKQGHTKDDEDVYMDLIGYLVILNIVSPFMAFN